MAQTNGRWPAATAARRSAASDMAVLAPPMLFAVALALIYVADPNWAWWQWVLAAGIVGMQIARAVRRFRRLGETP